MLVPSRHSGTIAAVTTRSFRPVLLAAALLVLAAPAMACPSCKDGSARDLNGNRTQRAYELSIYGMMSMPFLLAGTIGVLLWRSERNRRMRRAIAEHDASVPPTE